MVSTCYLRFRHPLRGNAGPTGGWPFPPTSHVVPMADAAGDVATDAEAAAAGVVENEEKCIRGGLGQNRNTTTRRVNDGSV